MISSNIRKKHSFQRLDTVCGEGNREGPRLAHFVNYMSAANQTNVINWIGYFVRTADFHCRRILKRRTTAQSLFC